MKGMILVAGEGTRIRPLSNFYAKPALPIPGGTILAHLIRSLAKSGIDEIALNLHYLPGTIYEAIENSSIWNVRLSPFDENEIAGSGGGIYRIRSFFENETFIVVNGDSICDINYQDVILHHKKSGNLITFLTQPDFSKSERVIDTDKEGKIIAIRKRPNIISDTFSHRYCGVMVIEPKLFDYFPDKYFIDLIEDVLIPMLEKNINIGGIYSAAFDWLDFGTPKDYFLNCFKYLKDVFPKIDNINNYCKQNSFFHYKTDKHPNSSRLEGTGIIEENSIIDDKSSLNNVIVYENCSIENSILTNSILFPHSYLENTIISDSIILPDGSIVPLL